jgi:hypothetical protein
MEIRSFASFNPMYTIISLLFFLATVPLCNGVSAPLSYSNTTTTAEPFHNFKGVYWVDQLVNITVPANATMAYTFYPGGGAHNYTTFTLTGPTTFTTTYTDGNVADFPYSTSVFTFTVGAGTKTTETLLPSVDESHSRGYMTKGMYPWAVETTFVLTGPTTFTTRAVSVGRVVVVSPPYALQSSPVLNPDVTTTAVAAPKSPAPQPPAAPAMSTMKTVFNPQPVVTPLAPQPQPVSSPAPAQAPPSPPAPKPAEPASPQSPKVETQASRTLTAQFSLQVPVSTATPLPAPKSEALSPPIPVASPVAPGPAAPTTPTALAAPIAPGPLPSTTPLLVATPIAPIPVSPNGPDASAPAAAPPAPPAAAAAPPAAAGVAVPPAALINGSLL